MPAETAEMKQLDDEFKKIGNWGLRKGFMFACTPIIGIVGVVSLIFSILYWGTGRTTNFYFDAYPSDIFYLISGIIFILFFLWSLVVIIRFCLPYKMPSQMTVTAMQKIVEKPKSVKRMAWSLYGIFKMRKIAEGVIAVYQKTIVLSEGSKLNET